MSERIHRINELIKEELSQILLEERIFGPDVLATILSVETSETKEDATIWVSVLPKERENYVLETLKSEAGSLQKILNRRIEMRYVPRIHWRIDHSEEHVGKIEEVLGDLETE